MEKTITIDTLSAEWLKEKKKEIDAYNRRVAIEEQMLAFLESKEEGSKTHTLEDGTKITILNKMTYSTDMDELLRLCEKIPENLRPIKPKLDETGAKYLRNNEPEVWSVLAPAISVKPAKPYITVKRN